MRKPPSRKLNLPELKTFQHAPISGPTQHATTLKNAVKDNLNAQTANQTTQDQTSRELNYRDRTIGTYTLTTNTGEPLATITTMNALPDDKQQIKATITGTIIDSPNEMTPKLHALWQYAAPKQTIINITYEETWRKKQNKQVQDIQCQYTFN